MPPVQKLTSRATTSALLARDPPRTPHLRNHLLASATAVSIILGASPMAAAGTVQFNPATSNNSLLQLYSSQSAFPVTGGTGALYENFALNSGKTGFTGAMVVNVTGFTDLSGTGIGLAP